MDHPGHIDKSEIITISLMGETVKPQGRVWQVLSFQTQVLLQMHWQLRYLCLEYQQASIFLNQYMHLINIKSVEEFSEMTKFLQQLTIQILNFLLINDLFSPTLLAAHTQ